MRHVEASLQKFTQYMVQKFMSKGTVLLQIGKTVRFWRQLRCISFSLAFFANLQLNLAITTSRLLGPASCLPHKDGGIPFSVLPKDTTNKLAGLFYTLSYL